MYKDIDNETIAENDLYRTVYPVTETSMEYKALKEFFKEVETDTAFDTVLQFINEFVYELPNDVENNYSDSVKNDVRITELLEQSKSFVRNAIILNNSYFYLSHVEREKFNRLLVIFNDTYKATLYMKNVTDQQYINLAIIANNVMRELNAMTDNIDHYFSDNFNDAINNFNELFSSDLFKQN